MKLVYIGSGKFGIDSLDALVETENNIALVITSVPQPAGRGKKPRPTAVASWAAKHSIPFLEVEDVNRPAVVAKIAAQNPDLIVVIAFGQKISNQLTTLPPKGIINVHASLLPKYRGAAPINWPIINGENRTGVTIISLTDKMDAGAMLGHTQTQIGSEETAGELHDRLAKIAAPLLVETIGKIAAGTVVYSEQDHARATIAKKLKKSDGFLDFNDSPESLERKIRGLWPWPGASAIYASTGGRREQVTFALAQAVERNAPPEVKPGTLDENLNVVCGTGALKIKKIKPAGSDLMNFRAFVNGRQSRPGDLFVKIEK